MKLKIKYLRLLIRLKNSYPVQLLYPLIKNWYDKISETNTQLSRQIFKFIPFLLTSAIVGFVAYFYAEIFRQTESLSFKLVNNYRWSVFILTPVAFVTSWWLVKRHSPYAKGGGIPQVMASMELSRPRTYKLIDHLLNIKVIIIKVLSSTVKVLGGGIVGREGPTIQISSAIFAIVDKYLPKWWKPISQKSVLVAGTASGIAAAFNTPLGGIIFAIEELSRFNIKNYGSSLYIAVIIAGLVAQTLGGSYLYLGYPRLATTGWVVYLGVLVVSIIAGFFGAKAGQYMWKMVVYLKRYDNLKQQLTVVLLASVLVAVSIYFLGTDAMGTGKSMINRILSNTGNKEVDWYIPLVRIGGMLSATASGGAGGIFAPSLSIGAAIGAVFASIMELSGTNANLMIVIGMTAFLVGITRSPFTSAIIIIEMTDRHSSIFHIMMAVVITSTIAHFVDKKSFYDHMKESYLSEVKQHKKSHNTTGEVAQ